jgi:glutaredoxin
MEQRAVVLYVGKRSLRCWRTRRLFARRGYHVEVVETTNGAAARPTLKQLGQSAYRETVPYVFVDLRPVGGFATIKDLDYSGDLERLVRVEI